ncbi:hypothetical protein MJT46_000032 [Ovis ammon polii x Ovis aries]|nr:hypothetical protein MJT46_000032 [Ovis ammon polii x Ovis aries]
MHVRKLPMTLALHVKRNNHIGLASGFLMGQPTSRESTQTSKSVLPLPFAFQESSRIDGPPGEIGNVGPQFKDSQTPYVNKDSKDILGFIVGEEGSKKTLLFDKDILQAFQSSRIQRCYETFFFPQKNKVFLVQMDMDIQEEKEQRSTDICKIPWKATWYERKTLEVIVILPYTSSYEAKLSSMKEGAGIKGPKGVVDMMPCEIKFARENCRKSLQRLKRSQRCEVGMDHALGAYGLR